MTCPQAQIKLALGFDVLTSNPYVMLSQQQTARRSCVAPTILAGAICEALCLAVCLSGCVELSNGGCLGVGGALNSNPSPLEPVPLAWLWALLIS